jgi:hypothetical protein
MSLLKRAVQNGRWDLAAHVIVLAAVRVMNQEVKPDERKNSKKTRRAKR